MVSNSCRALLALVLAAVLAEPAGAAIRVEADTAVRRTCDARLLEGAPGVEVTRSTAPGPGALTVRTEGPASSDWDLALFDPATGRRLASSATFGSSEMATAYLTAAGTVAVQACRRKGAAEAITVSDDFFAISLRPADAPREVAQLLTVSVEGKDDVRRLEALGLDVTHASTEDTVDVATYTAAERADLRAAGFRYTVRVADMVAADRRARAEESVSDVRALPSGRTTYRTAADYGKDLKALAEQFPGHVKPITLPTKSLEGRPIEGVEIAADVGRAGEGRPIFLLAGLTHAREWPSGELAIEFAIDIAKTFAAGTDPRVTRMLQRSRVIVLPLLNPDGFVVSRDIGGAAQSGGDDTELEATIPLIVSDAGAYKRKNCRAPVPQEQGTPCASRAPFGVDLNRAYSAFWGGPGTSTNPGSQAFRGPAPFSEPEAVAVRQFGSANQIQVFITNHTFTDVGRILRQPGFKIPNDIVGDVTPDEPIFAKLGDRMADATGYISELGYATLGNITGPSDDFLYYSQGTIGYTPELKGDNFHTNYNTAVIGEYEGEGDKKGRGWREAYIAAAEQAADPADHLTIRGAAPPGRILRLKKTTQLMTSDDENGDGTKDKPAMFVDETFDTTLTVPASGRYEWHVNPSTRPLAPARESFTFTCEDPRGAVLETQTVFGDRGDNVLRDFACPAAAPAPAQPGAAATPGPRATATPTPKPATPSPARRVRVLIRRPNASVRLTRRARGLSVYLNLRDGRLRGVRVRIVNRAGRTVLSGKRSRLDRSGRVRLRLKRGVRLRRGSHRVVLTARDQTGRPVRTVRSMRFGR